MSNKPVLAADLGGTKILASIVTAGGEILAEVRRQTPAAGGPDRVVEALGLALEGALDKKDMDLSQVDSICVAAAGTVKGGVVTASPNLPGWRDIPLGERLRARFGIDAFIIHDANAAALAEQGLGAGRGIDNFIYITVSTGIGGGIIIDGKLYTGASGSAGEVGHMTIDVSGPRCYCGNIGCLEVMASGTAMARRAVQRINSGQKSRLVDMVQGKLDKITARKVEVAARSGDALASAVIQEAANYLGVGLVNLVNILNPARIIIGGGMAKMGDLLLAPARRLVNERAFPQSSQAVQILTAELGDRVGIIGAAIYARQVREGVYEAP